MTTRRSTNKNIALVLGSLATLTGVGFGIGGGALVWAHNTQRDAAGFYATSAERIETPTFALTSEHIDLGMDSADYRWIPGDGATAVRLVTTANSGRPVFVGIARSADVEAYLANAAHAEVTDFEVDPFRPEMRQLGGPGRPGLPTDQKFWAASAQGAGAQTVTWPVKAGTWTVVIMNADASAGVGVDVAVGAKTGVLLPIGLGVAGFGLLVAGGGVALIVAGSRTARTPGTPPTPGPVAPRPEPSDDTEAPVAVSA